VQWDSFFASTAGTTTVDLSLPIPLRWSSRLRMVMDGTRDEAPIKIEFDLTSEVE
jgi:hypothetical protein